MIEPRHRQNSFEKKIKIPWKGKSVKATKFLTNFVRICRIEVPLFNAASLEQCNGKHRCWYDCMGFDCWFLDLVVDTCNTYVAWWNNEHTRRSHRIVWSSVNRILFRIPLESGCSTIFPSFRKQRGAFLGSFCTPILNSISKVCLLGFSYNSSENYF